MSHLINCPTCGAARTIRQDRDGTSSFAPARGLHAGIADGLDAYHAVNLREALKLVPDTGDWHGSLRAACEIALARPEGENIQPNQTAEQMMAGRARRMEAP